MRFMRHGQPRLAVVDGDTAIDIAADLRAELAAGRDLIAAGRAALASGAERLALSSLEFAPVVPEPGKTVCLGLNYFDHAKEGGRDRITRPLSRLWMRRPVAPGGSSSAVTNCSPSA